MKNQQLTLMSTKFLASAFQWGASAWHPGQNFVKNKITTQFPGSVFALLLPAIARRFITSGTLFIKKRVPLPLALTHFARLSRLSASLISYNEHRRVSAYCKCSEMRKFWLPICLQNSICQKLHQLSTGSYSCHSSRFQLGFLSNMFSFEFFITFTQIIRCNIFQFCFNSVFSRFEAGEVTV